MRCAPSLVTHRIHNLSICVKKFDSSDSSDSTDSTDPAIPLIPVIPAEFTDSIYCVSINKNRRGKWSCLSCEIGMFQTYFTKMVPVLPLRASRALSSEVMRAVPPVVFSTKLMQDSTLGSMLPGAK